MGSGYIPPYTRGIPPSAQDPTPKASGTRPAITARGVSRYSDPNSNSLPEAQMGVPVPYFIGRVRNFAPNIIWRGNTLYQVSYVEFPDPVTGETVPVGTYIYTLDIQVALGLGPDAHLLEVRRNNAVIWSGDIGPDPTEVTDQLLPGALKFYGGEFDQPVDDHLATVISDPLPAYVGVVYALLKAWPYGVLDESVTFDIGRYPDPLALGADNKIGDDINCATAIFDVLTNSWGGLGINPSAVDDGNFAAQGDILFDEGNGTSIAIVDSSVSPQETLDSLLKQVNGVLVVDPSTNQIRLRLRRDTDYDPEEAPLFDYNNIKAYPEFSKTSWDDTTDQLRLEYTDAAAGYNSAAVIAQTASVVRSGGRVRNPKTIQMPNVNTGALAIDIVSRELSYGAVPRYSLRFETNRDGANLLPFDIVTINYPEYGLDNVPMVVIKRRTQPLPMRSVVVEVGQYKFPRQNALFLSPDDPIIEDITPGLLPPTAVHGIIAPHYLKSRPEFDGQWINSWALDYAYGMYFPTAANDRQYLFNAFSRSISTSGGRFMTMFARRYPSIGTLDAAISKYDGFNTGVIASLTINDVDITTEIVLDNSGVERTGRVWLFINDEIMTYESATNDGGGSYTFTNVYRCLLDTVAQDHASEDFVYIHTQTREFVENTLIYGGPPDVGVIRDFTSVDPESVTATYFKDSGLDTAFEFEGIDQLSRYNKPLRPHDTRVEGVRDETPVDVERGEDVDVTWRTRSRLFQNIHFQTDAAVAGEQVEFFPEQTHTVYLRDSASTVHNLGNAAYGDNSKTVTIPALAALGAGVIYVRANFDSNQSLYDDEVPVNLVDP